MHKYLEPTDPEAFTDYPLQSSEEAAKYEMTVACPKCKGHGGWNLRLNAYPLHGKDDNPENRHKFSHFRASCSHCQGWGYVTSDNADHVHDWVWVRNTGNCLNLHECSICKRQWEIDSSD